MHRHAALFNAAVSKGDFGTFVETFAPDAIMRFVGAPAGPFVGREAIAAAYAQAPPDDTMSIIDVQAEGPSTARVRFAWTRGGTGAMTVSWRDDEVTDLTVEFDQS